MPIEIKELVIKATIDNSDSKATSSNRGKRGNGHDQLVETCVEKVLEILEKQKQR